MHQSRLASFLLSLCLHAGVIAAALFWPESAKPPVDLTAPIIDVNIYTIGSPGNPPAKAPSAPAAPVRPQAPQTPPQAPPNQPTAPTPPPDPKKPEPAPVKPDAQPVPIPQPDAPVEPPKPTQPPKPTEPPKPTQPSKPTQPPKPQRPQESPEDILRRTLGELGRNRPSDPGAVDRALDDLRSGGSDSTGSEQGGGGDGVGILGSYMQSLVSRIKPHWEYVGRADRRNPTAVVEIAIAKDGTIIEAVIVESSGDGAFDGSVLKAVNDTAKVEPPPTPDLARVRVPFAYEAIKKR